MNGEKLISEKTECGSNPLCQDCYHKIWRDSSKWAIPVLL